MPEYRAVAQDELDTAPDYSEWSRLIERAEEAAEGFLDADPPFDEVWLERRVVVEQPPPERIRTLRERVQSESASGGTL